MSAYLGVPLFHGGELVGLVGLANRPGGYDRRWSSSASRCSRASAPSSARCSWTRAGAREQALRDSEALYRATFEWRRGHRAHVDSRRPLLTRQPALRDMLGYAPAELPGLHFHDITLPEDLAASTATVAALQGESAT